MAAPSVPTLTSTLSMAWPLLAAVGWPGWPLPRLEASYEREGS